MPSASRSWLFLLILFFSVLYLIPLGERPLWIPDEVRYAEISREMIQDGNWVTPRLLGMRYFEKPVAGYWLNNASQLVFGENNFSVRFASVLTTGLSAVLLYWFALRLWGCPRKAGAGALIYLSSLLVYGIGTYAVLDAMVSLWINVSLVCLYLAMTARETRQRLIGYLSLGVAAGLGFLTKGFISLVIPVIVALPFALYQRQMRPLFLFGPLAILSAVVVCAPWAWMIHLQEPDFWNYFFWTEHIKRFAEENAQHREAFWFYIPVIVLGLIPWLGLVPVTLRQVWRNGKGYVDIVYLALWFLMPFLFFSITKGKLPTYILTCFMPLALLMAAGLIDALDAGLQRSLQWNSWLNLLFGMTGGVFLIIDHARENALLYRAGDEWPLILALAACSGWVLFSLLSLKNWWMAAACPAIAALLLVVLIPQHIVNGKLPETFIHQNRKVLENSPFIVSDNPGLATALAWTLKRTDILMLDARGELGYGMDYADAGERQLSRDQFIAWLSRVRRQGNVALVLRSDGKDLPPADMVQRRRRFTLLLYSKEEK